MGAKKRGEQSLSKWRLKPIIRMNFWRDIKEVERHLRETSASKWDLAAANELALETERTVKRIEFHPDNLKEYGKALPELKAILERLNFQIAAVALRLAGENKLTPSGPGEFTLADGSGRKVKLMEWREDDFYDTPGPAVRPS